MPPDRDRPTRRPAEDHEADALFSIAASSLVGFAAGAGRRNRRTNVGNFKDWNAFISTPGRQDVLRRLAADRFEVFTRRSTAATRRSSRSPGSRPRTSATRRARSSAISFAASAEVTVDIDGTKFKMFLDASHPDTAWAVPEQEAALVEAMKKGTKMTVTGTSSRGTAGHRHLFAVRHHRRARQDGQGVPVGR